jgi:uncharacterized membrane protein
MNINITIFIIILFYLLSPGILVTLPDSLPSTSKYTIALLHAVIFGLVYYYTYNFIEKFNVNSTIPCESNCTSTYNTCMFRCTSV